MLFFKTRREQCYSAHQSLICMQYLIILHLLRPPKFCLLYESFLLGKFLTRSVKINILRYTTFGNKWRSVPHDLPQMKVLVKFSKGS